MYLGTLLQRPGAPEFGDRRYLPLLLARAGEQRLALQVDGMLGSQRIVVKPLGPQLSTIRWISGGTILPDGRVAMIIDTLALIRSAASRALDTPVQPAVPAKQRRACVMVVDDSLTVRRVTSRMLQRQNMEVLTAQDGIEALRRLKAPKPEKKPASEDASSEEPLPEEGSEDEAFFERAILEKTLSEAPPAETVPGRI